MKKYHQNNRRWYAGALVCVLLSTAFAVVLQFVKGNVLDCAVAGRAREAASYALLLIAFILGEVLCYFAYDRLSARYAIGCILELKRDVFESILHRGYVAYKERTQGEYIAALTEKADAIRQSRFQMLPMFWEITFKIALVSAALFRLDGRIAVVTLALLTTPLYVPKLIEKRLQNARTEYLRAAEEQLAKVNDWLAGFEIIKNYAIEKRIMEGFQAANDKTRNRLVRDRQLGAVAQLLTTLMSYLSYFVVLVCAAWLVWRGDFSAGDFFVAIGMIDQLSYPLISLAGITRQLYAIRPACAEMEAFLEEARTPSSEEACHGLQSGIRFCDVSFAYDPARPILSHFSWTVEKGKRYLLKGPSGCGKTTAVNLLLRYCEVCGGSIELDGVPLEKAGDVYGLVTVVRQEAVLFHDTLRNNLTMYRDIPDERLMRALRGVGLERLANAGALDGVVTEGGANFSGGEKKRICIARALLRDTDVLILDEPLANLDAATAERIEDLLLSIPQKTLLVVSHQFSEGKLNRFDQVVTLAAPA